jgi:enolase
MNKFEISAIKAREIIDNRGSPTIRAYVCVGDEFWGWADVPCGSSTGTYEAKELRDGDLRYGGKGVRKAIRNIQEVIYPRLRGMDGTRQREIDFVMIELDGTDDKSELGANAILGVSLAAAKAAAAASCLPLYKYLNANAYILPVPQACMINGGIHAGNDLEFQEFCVMPVGAESFTEAVRMLCEINQGLGDLLAKTFGKGATNAGEDGGYAPPAKSAIEAMSLLTEAVQKAGYTNRVVYGVDVAATHFFQNQSEKYLLEGSKRNRQEMIEFHKQLVAEYPAIVSLEDPLHEDDFEGTREITKALEEIMIIGDDFFTTNINRLRKGVAEVAGNAILWKVNQIGSLTEALDVAAYAREHQYAVVVSERSGETEDDILSDITVALNTGIIKTGGVRGSERGSNYNRFMEIEEELGSGAVYAGRNYKIQP